MEEIAICNVEACRDELGEISANSAVHISTVSALINLAAESCAAEDTKTAQIQINGNVAGFAIT